MPRRAKAIKKKTEPDPVYKNRLVTKLINRSMRNGKKSIAQRHVYGSFEIVKEKGKDPMDVFSKALENIRPTMEVRPRRVGGAAYQVPMSVRGIRRDSLAIRWLIMSARARSNAEYNTFSEKLAAELLEAAKGEGGAVKRKTDMERMAEANRAFAHFRW